MILSGHSMKEEVPYNIQIHIHRFSVWAASRAVMSGIRKKGMHFNLQTGKMLIEISEIAEFVLSKKSLPDPNQFDEEHRKWRNIIISASNIENFGDGLAAKLINCYLKSALINPYTIDDPKIKALHPPIDRILLENLIVDPSLEFRKKCGIGNQIPAWSKLDSYKYENIIESIKQVVGYNIDKPSRGLWEIEKWWKIY